MREMIVNRDRAADMARRARETVEQNYSFEYRMDKMVQLYGELDSTKESP